MKIGTIKEIKNHEYRVGITPDNVKAFVAHGHQVYVCIFYVLFKGRKFMKIGTIKEIKNHEYRVGITPDNVKAFVAHGHQVYVETKAGEGAGFSDSEYKDAGAIVLNTPKEVCDAVEMVIKVKEPLASEYHLFRKDHILYTYLHLAADEALARHLMDLGLTAIAYETITDNQGHLPCLRPMSTDNQGHLPCLRPMSMIAGRLSIQEGAKYIEKAYGGRGILLCGVPGVERGKIVIIGGGIAGTYAAKAAVGIDAEVTLLDVDMNRLLYLEDIFIIGGGIAGTYAAKAAVGIDAEVTLLDVDMNRLLYLEDIFGASITTLYSTETNIINSLKQADVVIGSVLLPGAKTPKLIKKEYLKLMKPGSVIVDIAIDQGGCAESSHVTTHDDPVYIEDGVVHYCVGNMPGAVPHTSTLALTNATIPYALKIADLGLEAVLKGDEGFAKGVNICQHQCTNKAVAMSLNLEYKNLFELI